MFLLIPSPSRSYYRIPGQLALTKGVGAGALAYRLLLFGGLSSLVPRERPGSFNVDAPQSPPRVTSRQAKGRGLQASASRQALPVGAPMALGRWAIVRT